MFRFRRVLPSAVRAWHACLTGVAAAMALGVTALGTPVALAGPAGAATSGPSSPSAGTGVTLTVPTALGHGYRHGAVPRRTRDVGGVQTLHHAPAAGASVRSNRRLLTYGGGLTAGGLTAAGVTTGQAKVYLVFMGGQWGTEATSGAGQDTFSGDPDALAPALQTFYAGLGTDGETWSGIMTQYCDGAPVGATTCAQGDAMIPHPTDGVLAGVWYDASSAATAAETAGVTGHQLAAEAEAAATHFGNTDQASNRDAQYVIVSPTGTDPDGWADPRTGYCAYHDDSHDPSVDGGGPVTGPIVAFTNLPYVPDATVSCGSGSVNTPGILDGATEAASHEYAETITDQFPEATPPGGWSNSSGAEAADLCAYVSAPAVGAAFNLVLATGTVAVQGIFSNRANGGKGACSDGEPDYVFAPTVTGVSPASAPAGATVTVSGTNLAGATSVSFAGTPATVVSDTSVSITVTVPVGASDGTISVSTPDGTGSGSTVFHLAPSITSLAPTSAARGGTVTLLGSGLATVKKVTVGGKRASITSESATQVVFVVPAKASTGSVVVSGKYGTATAGSVLTVT